MNGLLIRQLRIERGWSQEELGEKVGMTQNQISLIEKNGTDRISLVKVFAEVFQVDWIDMLRETQ